MGIALYIQGYKKNQKSISGQIEILGWYEVDLVQIENHKIDGTFLVLHEDFNVFEFAAKRFYMFDFDDPGELAFYQNIMNSMSGGGFRNENGVFYGLMFDGGRILSIVSKILDSFDLVQLEDGNEEQEKNNLIAFKRILEVIAENNGLVGMNLC